MNDSYKVRILEKKEKFDKGKQNSAKSCILLIKRNEIKYQLKMRKENKTIWTTWCKTISNPISQTYIDINIKSKENAKITNRLIRNEDMTKQEDYNKSKETTKE